MKTIFVILLVLFSTQVFAAEDILICNNPIHVTEDKYKGRDIERVIMDRDSTTVLLKDGRIRKYSSSIQCYYEINSKRN